MRNRAQHRTATMWLLPALLLNGCAFGRVGTVAARRTLTPTAEVLDVYGFGLWLRTNRADAGLSFGWRHVTYIHPRHPGDSAEQGHRWSYGHAPVRREAPFFFAARGVGAEFSHYSGFTRAHVGYAMDAFTDAGRADEARTVSFRYRPSFPEATHLAVNPPPSPPIQ